MLPSIRLYYLVLSLTFKALKAFIVQAIEVFQKWIFSRLCTEVILVFEFPALSHWSFCNRVSYLRRSLLTPDQVLYKQSILELFIVEKSTIGTYERGRKFEFKLLFLIGAAVGHLNLSF